MLTFHWMFTKYEPIAGSNPAASTKQVFRSYLPILALFRFVGIPTLIKIALDLVHQDVADPTVFDRLPCVPFAARNVFDVLQKPEPFSF